MESGQKIYNTFGSIDFLIPKFQGLPKNNDLGDKGFAKPGRGKREGYLLLLSN